MRKASFLHIHLILVEDVALFSFAAIGTMQGILVCDRGGMK